MAPGLERSSDSFDPYKANAYSGGKDCIFLVYLYDTVSTQTHSGARLPSGLERWLVQATGLSWPGSNPTAENFASELWQFRLPRLASVFRRRH